MLFNALRALFAVGPLIFAAGFLWPLFTQLIVSAGWQPPFGLSPLVFGGGVAAGLGVMAQIRGTWLWQKD